MKLLIVLIFIAYAVAATPVENIGLLHYENDNIGTGSYKFSYEQDNGQKHQQEGELRGKGEGAFVAVKGSYSWISPDGVEHVVNYVADENGFQQSQKNKQSLITDRYLSLDVLRSLLEG